MNEHALETLRRLKIAGKHDRVEVVAVYPEAVLYVRNGKAMTCWLTAGNEKLNCLTEAGFPAFPNKEMA